MTTIGDLLDKYNAMQAQHGIDAPVAMLLWCREQSPGTVIDTMIRELETVIAEGAMRVFAAQQTGEDWRVDAARKYAVNQVERLLLKATLDFYRWR